MVSKEFSPKEKIMEAAGNLIESRGYSQTTMADIARDAGMSPGNIYRHFESKTDILEELARVWFLSIREEVESKTKDKNLTLEDRLFNILSTHLEAIFEVFINNPINNEAIGEILENRPYLINEHYDEVGLLVADILAEGNARGIFDVNIPDAVQGFLVATIKFTAPGMVIFDRGDNSIDGLKELARRVVKLLIKGLETRP